MSPNALFCPKDIHFTVKEERNQNILYIRETDAEDKWRNKEALLLPSVFLHFSHS